MKGAHNTDIVYDFYNDRVKEIVAASIIAEPFTYVPITAGHMELVGGNAIVFGKIKEGYDVINPSITPEITYSNVALDNPIVQLSFRFVQAIAIEMIYFNEFDPNPVEKDYWDGWQSRRKIYGYVEFIIPRIIIEDAVYNISVANAVEGLSSTTASYTAQAGDTYADVRTGLIADLTLKGLGGEIIAGLFGADRIFMFARDDSFAQTPNYEAGDVNTVYKNFTISFYVLSLGYTIKYPQLKCGATHAFGIVYKDRSGRVCSVVKTSVMDIYIPFYSEEVETDDNEMDTIINLIFKIWNKPPEWAESYEIVYYGNISMDYFQQIRVANITAIPGSSDKRFAINIIETFEDTWNKNNRWKVPAYEWNPDGGDRIRLLGTIDSGTGVVSKYDTLYDYEIEETGTQYGDAIGGDWLICQAVEKPTPFAGASNILVEVYRPRKGLGQTVPYGCGMVFEIGVDQYGNRYHKGDTDQVIDSQGVCTVEAVVNNTANDCWKFLRLNYKYGTSDIQPFWAESIFPSDWWDNLIISLKLTSNGFPFLDDLSQRQTILDERIRHGGFLITGTRTNNIAHFTYDDFMDLPKKNGDITGLREIGFTLKVLQMYKETSIYINRIQTFNPDGTEQFTLTDKFLAQQRAMEDDYGCQHPDSVMVNGRNLYYWDNSEGAFIRSSPNGQVVLDVKMKRWFKDLVKWIQSAGGGKLLQVRVGANNDHGEIWITFRMGDITTGLIFSEKDSRYKTRINQPSEAYVHIGNFFAHIYRQRVWIMNLDEGQGYLSWGGSSVEAEIEFVSNIDPKKNKIFNALAVYCNDLLDIPSRGIVIPEEASASSGIMETYVAIWDESEGIFYGQILKDQNTPGNFVDDNDTTMNGREMRGRYCYLKLKTTERSEKIKLDSVIVFSTSSERSA
jgi:hypothetical protein